MLKNHKTLKRYSNASKRALNNSQIEKVKQLVNNSYAEPYSDVSGKLVFKGLMYEWFGSDTTFRDIEEVNPQKTFNQKTVENDNTEFVKICFRR